MVCQKQDAARTAIRHLDHTGKALKARLYLIDGPLPVLLKYREQMFPRSGEYTLIGHTERAEGGRQGPTLLAELLLTTEETILTGKTIREATGIGSNHIDRALSSDLVAPVVASRGWRKVTLKEAGLPGKGWALMRPENLPVN
jgi:hypothetical protein